MESDHSILWIANWMVSIPLIVLTIIIHVLGLGLIVDGVFRVMLRALGNLRFMVVFAILMTTPSALVVILHAMEGALWAAAYLSIGALSDVKSAMLYSLNAMTSYGHETRALNGRWALLGALESLNGMILFGLTTAFLFHVFQTMWSFGGRRWSLAPATSDPSAPGQTPPDPQR